MDESIGRETLELSPVFDVLFERPSLTGRLFVVESQRIANNALKACKVCRNRPYLSLREDVGIAFGFDVNCSTCKKVSPTFGVAKDDAADRKALLAALSKAVDYWNAKNARGAQ